MKGGAIAIKGKQRHELDFSHHPSFAMPSEVDQVNCHLLLHPTCSTMRPTCQFLGMRPHQTFFSKWKDTEELTQAVVVSSTSRYNILHKLEHAPPGMSMHVWNTGKTGLFKAPSRQPRQPERVIQLFEEPSKSAQAEIPTTCNKAWEAAASLPRPSDHHFWKLWMWSCFWRMASDLQIINTFSNCHCIYFKSTWVPNVSCRKTSTGQLKTKQAETKERAAWALDSLESASLWFSWAGLCLWCWS